MQATITGVVALTALSASEEAQVACVVGKTFPVELSYAYHSLSDPEAMSSWVAIVGNTVN